jgi:uncharacterized protein
MVGWTLRVKSEMTNQYSNDKRMNNPLLLALLTIAGLHVAKLWDQDRRAARTGTPTGNPLPGATDASRRSIAIAVLGALALLALETFGEVALGIGGEQSRMTWLFALYSVCAAPVIEEIIFRGWLVIEHGGRTAQWAGAVAASIAFAALHPFLWRWDSGGLALTLGTKGWFSSAIVFATSVWFYVARLAAWNPRRSLLPCFAAHAAKNVGVVAIKAASGFMAGVW